MLGDGQPVAASSFSSACLQQQGSTDGEMPSESPAAAQFESTARSFAESRGRLTEAEHVEYEARLVRLLSGAMRENSCPSLSSWLDIVGLTSDEIRILTPLFADLPSLVQYDAKQLSSVCEHASLGGESTNRLLRSTERLRRYLLTCSGTGDDQARFLDKQLSWSTQSPTVSDPSRASPSVLSAPSKDLRRGSSPASVSPGMTRVSFAARAERGADMSRAATPRTLCPPSPLIVHSTNTPTSSTPTLTGGRNARRVAHSTSMQFGPAKSPKTTRFHHEIPHVWTRRSTFHFTDNTCSFCRRPLGFGFLSTWEKCKSCKLKVHSHCKSRMGDTCGLTPDHLRALFDDMVQAGNSDAWGGPQSATALAGSRSLNEPAFQYPDSAALVGDSSSSTNSSAPSTPAMVNVVGSSSSPYAVSHRGPGKFFTFPDSVPELPDIVLPENNDDRPTESGGEVTEGSEGTLVVDSQDSAGDSAVSELSPSGHTWDRTRWNMSTIRGASTQSGWSDVTIPFQKIEFKKNNLIGRGRFGDVKRGYHFGDVAVKFLNMEHVEEEKRLEEFKTEVANFKNCRHDNIVLCLGYCLEQNKLGIVMSLCKGRSLHSMIHTAGEKIDMISAIVYATQICQGVSYLHQKKIIHKDLRSKNIFIENKNKVVVTDLGLFSMKRLRYPERKDKILVPNYWLSYLAPELIRAVSGDLRDIPFSEHSDVFAFGTIWYELITCRMPFAGVPSDQIIYRVGTGTKAPLHNLSVLREVKEILLRTWAFSGGERPSFTACLALLHALPKKRLDRSPSYPMVRSYESIF